jgi:tetratricopeptide (TPR) repeat protein
MSTKAFRCGTAFFAAMLCIWCAAGNGEEPKKSPPTKEQIAKWIRELGDNDFEVRQSASKRLWETGKTSEALLREALSSDDAEVVRRSRELLDKFKWGIYPDTPENIVQLIEQYRSSEDEAPRREAIVKLLDADTAGLAALVRIAHAEENEAARTLVIENVTAASAQALPHVLMDGDYATLEDLLEVCALESTDPNIEAPVYNYVAFCLLDKRLDDRVKQFKGRFDVKPSASVRRLLVHLLCVKGDLAEARKVAGDDDRLLEHVLHQQRDWKALAERKAENAADEPGKMALAAAYHHLAGNTKEANRILDAMRKHIEDNLQPGANGDPNISTSVLLVARALMLNDRTKDALDLLRKDAKIAGQFEMAVDVLAMQTRIKEALELLDEAPAPNPESRWQPDLKRARLLQQVGEKDKAVEIFKKLAGRIQPEADANYFCELIEAENECGFKDLAREHAVELLGRSINDALEQRVLAVFHPKENESAHIWWEVLRGDRDQDRKIDTAALFKQWQAIMDGKPVDAKWSEELARRAADKDKPDDERERGYLALAQASQAAGRQKEAQAHLEKACALQNAGISSFLKLGDLHAARQGWDKAADVYQRGAQHNRMEALPVYLSGWALIKAGQAEKGGKQIELSHWIPLGSAERRMDFAQELARRGFADDARRERELILRICGTSVGDNFEDEQRARSAAESLRAQAIDAVRRNQYLKAAEYSEIAMLPLHRPEISFALPASYFAVPQQIHRFRARGLLDQGKIEEALKEADYCQTNDLADIELPILMTAALEAKGRKKDADRIYAKVHDLMVEYCKQYPQSASGHNNIAWLCVRCRRDLPEGLKQAQRANELSPDTASYLDTLAEAHFQTGDKDKAVALMRRCTELEPKRSYFQKQLKRMEKGDPKSEVPEELGDED